MHSKRILCLIGMLVFTANLWCQGVDLAVSPWLDLPTGPIDSNQAAVYSVGGGGSISLDVPLPFASLLYARAQAGYDLLGIPSDATPGSLSLVSVGAGGGVGLALLPSLRVKLSLTGGASMFLVPEFLRDSDPTNDLFIFPFARAELALGYRVSPVMDIYVSAAFIHHFTVPTAYQGAGVAVGASFHLGKESTRVKVQDLLIDPIFPVLFSSYGEHSFGSLTLVNGETGAIQDVRVSFFVKEYMDTPMQMREVASIPPGTSKTIPLYAVFNDDLMQVTEGKKLAADVKVEYSYGEQKRTLAASPTLTTFDRNAMTWDDTRKAAAFVTAKSPTVLSLSKALSGIARSQSPKAISENFRTAAAVFEGLGLYGMRYVVDPSSSYQEKVAQAQAVDYLQFPSETLKYRSGDCDDLSILYAALLESVAVSTAFVTVPGHIFVAFDLGLNPDAARRTIATMRDLIFSGEGVWVPVEITLMDRGFLAAWREGAREWRDASAQGTADLVEMKKAWSAYSPVGIAEKAEIAFPSDQDVARRYTIALQNVVQREIADQETTLGNEIARHVSEEKNLNRLGVLYARYGLVDKARAAFDKAIALSANTPQLSNRANLAFMEGDYENAVEYYGRAAARDPRHLGARIGLLLVYNALGDDRRVAEALAALRDIDPATADKYVGLGTVQSGSRALNADRQGGIVWSE